MVTTNGAYNYSGWPKVYHNVITMPESQEAHLK